MAATSAQVHPAAARTRAGLGALAFSLVALGVAAPLVATPLAALVVLAVLPLHATGAARLGQLLLLGLVAAQFSYAVPWPDAFPPRVATVWVLGAVVLLVRLALRSDPADALRAALPRIGAPEAAVAGFGLLLGWWFLPWAGDADHVLVRMMLGWDHAGHFAMVEQLRSPTEAFAGAFGGYPRGYHAGVAALMEVGIGRSAPLAAEFAAYGHASVVVVALTLLMAAALACAAPVFRRRPLLLAPALAGLTTLFLQVEDTAQVPYYGFGGFLVAAGLATAAALLVLTWRRDADVGHWLLFGAAVAGVFGTWTILLAFLAPVPLAVWVARRAEPGTLLRLIRTAPAALPVPALALLTHQSPAAGLAGEGTGATQTLGAAIDRFLLLGGAIRTSSLGWPIVFALAGLLLPLVAGWLAGRRTSAASRAELASVAALALVSAVALALAGGMLGYEYARVGGPRYYGIKVLCATTVVAGTIGLVAAATIADAAAPRWRSARVALTAAATVALLFAVGSPVPLGALPLSPGGAVRRDLASTGPDRRAGLAQALRAACAVIDGRPGEYYLLTPGTNHEDAVRVGVWVIGCGQNWDSDQSSVLRTLLPDRAGQGAEIVLDVPRDSARILTARPRAVVIVPAHLAPAVRAAVGPFRGDRVLTI
nr:hypothetical protein [Propionibacterium sp.]